MKSINTVLFVAFFFFLSFRVMSQVSLLWSFGGGTDGRHPEGQLYSDGNYLYGLTYQGGSHTKGTAFRILPDGTNYSLLLNFTGANGSYPTGSLISDGTYLYGMTQQGGANNQGTLFRMLPDGSSYSRLLDFSGAADGRYPQGSLMYDGTWLYGLAFRGGAHDSGTVFKLLPNGTLFTKLLDFSGTNGSWPYGSLISDSTYLYGTTRWGGTHDRGTLFKVRKDGTGFVRLHDFANAVDGSHPTCDLAYDGTWLYGTTQEGGNAGMGVVFKILSGSGSYTKLHDFSGGNGSYPYTGALALQGNTLYGSTQSGGLQNMGTLFTILTDGTGFATLVHFDGTCGSYPYSGVLLTGNEWLGMTEQGGSQGVGALFRYAIPAGMAEPAHFGTYALYPNPAEGTTGLHGDRQFHPGEHFELLALTGQRLSSGSLPVGKMEWLLDVSTLAPGVYFLKILPGGEIFRLVVY